MLSHFCAWYEPHTDIKYKGTLGTQTNGIVLALPVYTEIRVRN